MQTSYNLLRDKSVHTQEKYDQIVQELIIYLRGEKTQIMLSQELGYSFNQVGKWESGVTRFYWSDLVQYCKNLNLPITEATTTSFVFHEDMSLDQQNIFQVIARLFGYLSMDEMAHHLHRSRSSLQRMMKRDSKVDLTDVLRLMNERPYVMTGWLRKFAKIENFISLQEQLAAESTVFRGLISIPWASIVNSALLIEAHVQAPETDLNFIAECTGLDQEEIQMALNKMLECGTIEKRGRKYISLTQQITFLQIPEFRIISSFLAKRLSEYSRANGKRYPNLQSPSITATRVHSISKEAGKKIVDATIDYHHRVGEIIRMDTLPADHVRVILVQCLDLEVIHRMKMDDQSQASSPSH